MEFTLRNIYILQCQNQLLTDFYEWYFSSETNFSFIQFFAIGAILNVFYI